MGNWYQIQFVQRWQSRTYSDKLYVSQKTKQKIHWSYQLLFSPNKKITRSIITRYCIIRCVFVSHFCFQYKSLIFTLNTGHYTPKYPCSSPNVMIWYWINGNYDQNVHDLWNWYTYLSTTYHLSFYDITYKTLDNTQFSILLL